MGGLRACVQGKCPVNIYIGNYSGAFEFSPDSSDFNVVWGALALLQWAAAC